MFNTQNVVTLAMFSIQNVATLSTFTTNVATLFLAATAAQEVGRSLIQYVRP